MVQEYLLTSDEFKPELKNLVIPDGVERNIITIENSSCWIFKLSTPGKDEKAAARLSAIAFGFCEKYNAVVLTDECSSYFNKSLFPIVNEFERKLRKLLYLASALQEDKKVKDAISNLESKNLDELFNTLFFDTAFLTTVKKKVNQKDLQIRRSDLVNEINNIDEFVIWDTILGIDCVPTLQKKHRGLRKFRNDVMHAHNLNISEFREARSMFRKVNAELDEATEKIVGAKEENKQLTPMNFNSILIDALSEMQQQTKEADTSSLANSLILLAKELNYSRDYKTDDI